MKFHIHLIHPLRVGLTNSKFDNLIVGSISSKFDKITRFYKTHSYKLDYELQCNVTGRIISLASFMDS